MDPLVLLPLLVAITVSGAIAAAEWQSFARRMRRWQTLRLTFGRDLTSEATEVLIGAISGLPRRRFVALEAHADANGIEHRLASDQATIDSLRAQLRGLIPSLRLTPVDEKPITWNRGLIIRRAPRNSVLRTDDPAGATAAMLGSLQPLGKDERLVIRWLLAPGRAEVISDAPEDSQQAQRLFFAQPRLTGEHRRLLRAKNAGSVVRGRGVIAVSAAPSGRQRHLLSRLAAVLRTRGTPYGHLRMRVRRGAALSRAANARFLLFADTYSPSELAGLLAWPVAGPLPGVSLGTSLLLMPSHEIPREGRVLGKATWPSDQRPIAQPVIGGLSHSLISGPTGTGKSALLTNLILGDIAAGRGSVLFDGKGDTYEAVLSRLPADRRDDLICLDCTTGGPLPGLKLLAGDSPQLTADVVLGVLSDLFRDSWGPLSERYLRAGLVAVAHDREGTLADLPYVFTDAAYRRRLTGLIRDPLVEATFASLEAMKPAERLHQLSAPLNKLGIVLGRPTVRAVLGQRDPAIDFSAVLSRRKIVLINLNPSRIGASASRLIGALGIYALFQATLARGKIPMNLRRPLFVYLDEPKSLGDLPMPLDTLFEQARGLGVGLTLAPQSMTQLPQRVREAVMTNVATRVVFRSSADDARLLVRDLPGVEAEDLSELGQFQTVARIGLGTGAVAAPVTLRTYRLAKATNNGQQLAAEAAGRHGHLPGEVDAALRARHDSADRAPIGRKRRSA